ERHPSSPCWSSSDTSTRRGLSTYPTSPSIFQENARRFTPIWFAARPARPSASTVSTRSVTRERTLWSMREISSQAVRSTGSPTILMSRKAMGIFSLIRTHARYTRYSQTGTPSSERVASGQHGCEKLPLDVALADLRIDKSHHLATRLVRVDPNRGEGRRDLGSEWDLLAKDYRQVPISFHKRRTGPESHRQRRHHERIVFVIQGSYCLGDVLKGVAHLDDHRTRSSFGELTADGSVAVAKKERWMPHALVGERLNRQLRHSPKVGTYRGHPFHALLHAGHHHDPLRAALPDAVRDGIRGDIVRRGDDHSVDPLSRELTEHSLKPGGAVTQVVEHDSETDVFSGGRHGLREPSMEGLRDVSYRQGYHTSSAAAQSSRDAVRRVPQSLSSVLDAFERSLRDTIRLIEHTRDGGSRDSCLPRDIENRRLRFWGPAHGAIILNATAAHLVADTPDSRRPRHPSEPLREPSQGRGVPRACLHNNHPHPWCLQE